jgi:hypothetical protein
MIYLKPLLAITAIEATSPISLTNKSQNSGLRKTLSTVCVIATVIIGLTGLTVSDVTTRTIWRLPATTIPAVKF